MVTKKWTVELRGIRDILRLGGEERYKFLEIAESLSISHQTVSKHVATVHNSGLDFAQALELSDQELKALIYPKTPGPLSEGKVTPDFDELIKELANHRSLTPKVVWDEYRAQFGNRSYSYSQFCVQGYPSLHHPSSSVATIPRIHLDLRLGH